MGGRGVVVVVDVIKMFNLKLYKKKLWSRSRLKIYYFIFFAVLPYQFARKRIGILPNLNNSQEPEPVLFGPLKPEPEPREKKYQEPEPETIGKKNQEPEPLKN